MPGLPQYAPIRSARSNREASGRGAARRGGAGPRASRSQGRALPLRYEPQLRGHLTDHQGVWHQAGGPCSLRPKRAALRRLLPLGILDPHEVTRRSLLLRPATCSGQDSQPGATSDRESPGRDPSWLSEAWGGLSGGCCLAQSGVARRLTDADVGYLAPQQPAPHQEEPADEDAGDQDPAGRHEPVLWFWFRRHGRRWALERVGAPIERGRGDDK